MLNNEHSSMLMNQLSHQSDIRHQEELGYLVTKEEYVLVELLKPRIFMDGDKWCVLHGENLQDGIAGFGDTPYRAVLDFNLQWHAPIKPGRE